MQTRVVITKNEEGAVYEGLVYDYWVTCKLMNGTELVLFDSKPIDVTEYVNQEVFITISALFVEKEFNQNLYCFEGKMILKDNNYFFVNDYISIKISKRDIETNNLKIEFLSTFYFGRLDIINISNLHNEKFIYILK